MHRDGFARAERVCRCDMESQSPSLIGQRVSLTLMGADAVRGNSRRSLLVKLCHAERSALLNPNLNSEYRLGPDHAQGLEVVTHEAMRLVLL